jgi:hypothetical protein
MGIGRKLEEVRKTLDSMGTQKDIVKFLNNSENAQRVNGLVEDIRDALVDYQVCSSNYSLLPRLTFAPDFIATRYLRQELFAHRGSYPLTFLSLG